ncbi:hypothetical protein GOARA_048_01070 [Gordonia araii NBRC 100433]|uniref:DUF937 domain-containing protein n=1 Tax=Gordonia araii NBRC 100433 TaxID=1073574 RepID=G7H230_9ACTN|nr:DUF937 domain-containing protein [Gordonia araii]NNG97238.1 DUF937 domain-containing protein [Gordonia araii NBRC 100433]GAB09905.1 hypothetical protein GOARA_048_01070 [Gordonia araii NBRC 100433]
MSELDDLLKSIPVGDIASKLGVDESTAGAAVAQAVPTLLAGLQAHAETDGPAPEDLTKAADDGDGDGVVKGLFGDKTDDVAKAAAGQAPAGVNSDLIKKVMPMLAPLVIAFVTQKLMSGQGGGQQQQAGGAGGALGQILGGALGGGGGAGGAGGLGSILGSVLGGGGGQQQAGGAGGALGSILGGILGGKK